MKPLKNAEAQLKEILEGDGWEVTHKGWPDFVCVKDGKMVFVEVKGYKGEMLRKEQHYVLTNLAKLGLDCYKWDPEDGFLRIEPQTPRIPPNKDGKKRPERLTYEEKLDRLSPEERTKVIKEGVYL